MNNRTTFFAEWLTLADVHLKKPGEKLAFYDAVLRYGLFGQLPLATGKVQICFELAKTQIDIIKKRHNRYCSNLDTRQLADNCATIGEQTADNCLTNDTPFKINDEVLDNSKSLKKNQVLRQKEKEQEKESFSEKDFEDLIPDHLKNDSDFRAEWSTWLSYRRGTHRSVSRAAASRQLKLLGDYEPHDAILIIENSITNDWQGLFPAKTKNLKPRRDYTGI